MRPLSHRPDHGLDLALPLPRPHDDAGGIPADNRALRALAEENAMLARELGRVQARCTQWRDDCIVQADRLEALLVRVRGELLAKETALAAARDLLTSPAPVSLVARRVLCVGGRARQVPVYRELVERAGGQFTHVDGTSVGLAALRSALMDADLVILQPAFANQSVCQAVQSHCARHAVRCLQLDKTCVPGFLQGLAQSISPP
jgi:hypothetical protein